MSCETNSSKVSKLGAVAAGVSTCASKTGHVAGAMMVKMKEATTSLPANINQGLSRAREVVSPAANVALVKVQEAAVSLQHNLQPENLSANINNGINRVGETIAPATNVVVDTLADPEKRHHLQTLGKIAIGTTEAVQVGVGVTLVRGNPIAGIESAAKIIGQTAAQAENPSSGFGIRRKSRRVVTAPFRFLFSQVVRKPIEKITTTFSTGLAEATKTEDLEDVVQTRPRLIFFKSEQHIPVWKSRLTGPLNRLDVVGAIDSKNIVSSNGAMLKINKVTWHRGTTVVKMPNGRRTITHLQSLKAPGAHHFFNKPVSDETAAGIATGLVNPETVLGFVGSISQTESMFPIWAHTKRAMLLTRLHWPSKAK
ncbi:MAG: hypothetical protein BroJett011_19510 [Chloroflexota bacterium]|nr:MAG: hypothetical protein BroJett011_19510 [Chloroflexota bacterium]